MLTQQELKQNLVYNRSTGEFTNIRKNKIVGSVDKSCNMVRVSVGYTKYLAHKLAWLYMYGTYPTVLKHIDGDTTNNRIDNLIENTTLISKELTQDRLKQLISYDEATGILTRLFSERVVSSEGVTDGYRQISLDGKQYKQHRIIWLYVYGYFPEEIDHINGIRTDNRLSNLREVTRRENSTNKRIRSDNTSGVTGIHYRKDTGKYVAYIQNLEGKTVRLGSFIIKEDAIQARREVEKLYKYHENNGRN
jgi:hypothetical protein